jgi:hypothetical protein
MQSWILKKLLFTPNSFKGKQTIVKATMARMPLSKDSPFLETILMVVMTKRK